MTSNHAHKPDHALRGIVAYGVIARQPSDADMDKEATQACVFMTVDELAAAHKAAWCLCRHASTELAKRQRA